MSDQALLEAVRKNLHSFLEKTDPNTSVVLYMAAAQALMLDRVAEALEKLAADDLPPGRG